MNRAWPTEHRLNRAREFAQIFTATEDRVGAQQAGRQERVWAGWIWSSILDVVQLQPASQRVNSKGDGVQGGVRKAV